MGGRETIYPEYRSKPNAGGRAAVREASDERRTAQLRNPDNGDIEVLRVQGNIYVIAGAGGNVVVQVGPSGILMVDSKSVPLTDRLMTEIKTLSVLDKPIRYSLNTSADADH